MEKAINTLKGIIMKEKILKRRGWFQEHHAPEKEAWLAIRKKHASMPGFFYEDAVAEALCFGWIDGIMHFEKTLKSG